MSIETKTRQVALFDLDKTVFNDHSFFPLTKYMVDEGILPEVVWSEVVTELGKYKQKTQTYSVTANNLLGIFGNGLKGKKYEDVLGKTKQFFELNRNNFYPYFEKVLPRLLQTHEVYLVTTNSQMVAEVVVGMFGLSGYLSTQFEVVDRVFTGKITSTLADGKHVVEEVIGNNLEGSLGFGDSENDIGMLERVKHPVCINPSDELLEVAKQKRWTVFSDQTAEKGILDMLDKTK